MVTNFELHLEFATKAPNQTFSCDVITNFVHFPTQMEHTGTWSGSESTKSTLTVNMKCPQTAAHYLT